MSERGPQGDERPLRIAIIGGGTAGWMTAAGLAGTLRPGMASITLVESDEIGTVGVGEATLPQIRAFNERIGIIEADMMRRTEATFKLGIQFVDWGFAGSDYIHPFGTFGRSMGGVAFQNQWVRARQGGFAEPIEHYSYAIKAARAARFDMPDEDRASVRSTFDYAYHFDASLYAAYLRTFSEKRGVERVEGRVTNVSLDASTGAIRTVHLQSGAAIEADLFVDCSGFRALLIGDALGAVWEDWGHWLPCDSAWAVPCARNGPLTPYTRSTARQAGWQWRIPLQHRTGNGHIFSSRFISDDEAASQLLSGLDGEALAEPRLLRFTAGRRLQSWQRNCVAIGLASGFLEPLESTSIYLIQVGIEALLQLLPGRQPDPALASEFNRRMDIEYARIRDFLILHYHANVRTDGAMWRECREMPVPDTLAQRIALFRHRAHVQPYGQGLFSPPSWLSVLLGQGIEPSGFHPMALSLNDLELERSLADLAAAIATGVAAMPDYASFIEDYCPAIRPRAGRSAELAG